MTRGFQPAPTLLPIYAFNQVPLVCFLSFSLILFLLVILGNLPARVLHAEHTCPFSLKTLANSIGEPL
jgi:hypothetical protein